MAQPRRFFFLLVFFCLTPLISGQELGVHLLCSPRSDSILLRWAPQNPQSWRLANEYGYTVKRYTVLRDKKMPKEIEETLLTNQPVKPAPLTSWEKYADNKYIAIAAECIFGSYYNDIPTAGNPHIAYKKYQEENHRFSFALYAADQSLKVAELSGLYLADKTARENEKYLYRVSINCPDSIVTDTAFAFTGISEYAPLPKPLDLRAEWEDKEVTLSWNIKYLNHIYNSYIVEKSTDRGRNYQQLGENATVQLSDKNIFPDNIYKTDTLEDNSSLFYYRVRGITAFGETGPASDSVFGTGMLPLKNAPVIVDNEVMHNRYVTLQWEYPEEMNPYINGFKIYRSSKPSGRKQLVYLGKNPNQREFTDSTADFTNYYLISVYSERDEKLSPLRSYAERIDSFPPAPPVLHRGTVDTTGKVLLTWSPNSEKDMKGYRVYWANNPRFEFMLAAQQIITDTFYVDSINIKTLTKNVYYKVKAVDVRDNQSGFSAMLELERPDIVPPVAPVIKNIAAKNDMPEINWVNSRSSDVQYHHIYRKKLADTVSVKITTLEKENAIRSAFTDKTAESGNEYTYFVTAEDESGNISALSNPGYFKVSSDIKEKVKLKSKEYTDHVVLSWNISSDKTIQRVIVFRSVNDEPMRLYGNSEEDTYTDEKLSPEKTYTYMIKAVYEDGNSSGLSNTVKVKM